MNLTCPTCDADVNLPVGTVASEVINCIECHTRLVVDAVGSTPSISLAPQIEEDWGE